MKVSIIGTVGVPAKYGGFETLVENMLTHQQSKNIEYTVFCSKKHYTTLPSKYKGAYLKYINLSANGLSSIIYDILSMLRSIRNSDVMLILGVSGCLFLPILRLIYYKQIVVNIDGLEHRREKWSWAVQKFLKFSELFAVRFSDLVIADNKAIYDYVLDEYGVKSELIAYGGDHVLCDLDSSSCTVLDEYNLSDHDYSLSICRIEPENNIHTILSAYSMSRQLLVFIGNWDNSSYGRDLKEKYSLFENIQLIDPIYDIERLNILRSNCNLYIHGHSAGGTNPSLVEAMFFEKPIIAFNCKYNIESTENKAIYFDNDAHLFELIQLDNSEYMRCAKMMYQIAVKRYKWTDIVRKYESIFKKK